MTDSPPRSDEPTSSDTPTQESAAAWYWRQMHKFDARMRELAQELPGDRIPLDRPRPLETEQKQLLELKAKLRAFNDEQRQALTD